MSSAYQNSQSNRVLDALSQDTFALAETLNPGVGQRVIVRERANAEYIVQPDGYVALADDITFANGRVGAFQKGEKITTASLIGSSVLFNVGTVINSTGYTTDGDGGGGQWVKTAITGQAPSQSPSQIGDALLNDANGNQWALVTCGELNVLSVGALGNNSQDNLLPFNAAIAGGSKNLFVPEGTYNLSATWLFNDNDVTVRFAGQGVCTIVPTFATTNIIQIGASGLTKNIHFRGGFTIDAPSGVPRTANAGIGLFDAQQCSIESCELNNMFYGMYINGPNTTHVVFNDMVIRNVVPTTGIGVFIDGGGDHFFNNLSINNGEFLQGMAGIRIRQSNATWIDNSDILHSGIGMLVNPGDGHVVGWLFVNNTAFDLNTLDGVRIKSSVGTNVINKGHQFTACWTSSNGLAGVRISGDDIPDGVHFADHRAVNNGGNGYLIEKGVNITFDACKAGGNSQTTPNASAGIQINADVQKFAVRNCTSGNLYRYGVTQGRGLAINSGTSDNYIVMGNDFTGNTLGPSDGGTGVNKVFTNNIS
jgi:hypothetical protein